MHPRLRQYLKYGLFLAGGIGLAWWQLRDMSAVERLEFKNALSHSEYVYILPVILMSVLSHLSRAARWRLLMEPLGYKPGLTNLFLTTMSGYLANAAVPRLGEVLKCSLLARYENLRTDKLIGTILLERAFDLFCYLLFTLLTLLIQLDTLYSFVQERLSVLRWNGRSLAAGSFRILAVGVALFFIARWLMRRKPENRILMAITGFGKGVREGLRSVSRIRNRPLFLAHTLFIWAMYLGQIYVGFQALPETAALPVGAAFSVLTLATLSMILTPGGIGSFPYFVMQTLLLYGISQPMGQAFGWMMWGVSTALVLVIGTLSLIALPYANRNKSKIQPE